MSTFDIVLRVVICVSITAVIVLNSYKVGLKIGYQKGAKMVIKEWRKTLDGSDYDG